MTDLKANIKFTAKDEASAVTKKVAAGVRAAADEAARASREAISNEAKVAAAARAAAVEAQAAARRVAEHRNSLLQARVYRERRVAQQVAATARAAVVEQQSSARRAAEHYNSLLQARAYREKRTAELAQEAATRAHKNVATSLENLRRRGGGGLTGLFDTDVTKSYGRVRDSLMGIGRAATIGLGAAAFAFKGFIDTAAEFESLHTQLESIEGSSSKADKAMSWIKQFAKETPGSVKGVTEAYVLLRNFGLQPMNGTMKAVMDTTSKFGFTQDRLMGISLALGQAWTKNKLQGQEINQLTERGVPVVMLLSKALGKTTSEIYAMSEAGQLGHKEINILIKAMGKAADGSSARAMTTWAGTMARLGDTWESFKVSVMASGPFERLKTRLTGVLERFDAMEKDGSMAKFAAETGRQITAVIDWFEKAGRAVGSVISAVGGVGNALTIVAAGFAAVQAIKVGLLVADLARYTAATWAYVAARRAANVADGASGLGGAAKAAGGGMLPKVAGAAKSVLPAAAGAAGAGMLGLGVAGLGVAAYGAYQMNEQDKLDRADPAKMAERRARMRAALAAQRAQFPGAMAAGGHGGGRQEVGGTIKIEVDDNRTRVTRVQSSGGVQLDVAGGLSLGGNG